MGGFIPDSWDSWIGDLGLVSVAAAGIGALFRLAVKPILKVVDLIHDTVTQLMTIASHVTKLEERVSKLEQLSPEGDNK